MDRAITGWEGIFGKLKSKLPKVRAPTMVLKQKRKEFLKEQAIRELYPLSHTEEKKGEFEREKHKYIFYVLLAACAFAILSSVDSLLDQEPVGGALARNPPGGTDRTLSLDVDFEGGGGYEELPVTIEARQYTDKELAAYYQAMLPVLEKTVLNGNADFDHVTKNLYLPTSVPGYPFNLKWQSGDYDILDDSGHFMKDEFQDEGEAVSLSVAVSCQDFEKEFSFVVVLRNIEKGDEEQEYQKFAKAVSEAVSKQPEAEKAHLPEEFEGKALTWKKTGEGMGGLILLFGVLLSFVMGAARESNLADRVKKRDQSLLYAYPDFVNKLSLYMGAGMSISSCLAKIAQEEREVPDFLHQELRYTLNELAGGVSEKEAIEGFGKRCRLACYIKLTTLLVQNLRKGGGQLLPRLKEEAGNAFAMRKNLAREAGEKAGTKLLFPMLLMMGVVMVIIIVPAFTGFEM
ncbi:MAG: type II secretion system F family protein [Lachnospiraceae bacterium]|nr:type II secretion system F family protein [Lachnospiraceae bacterium]